MLQRPKIPSDALSSAFSWEARVDSWLGQTWLGRVPVKAGSVTWTTSQQVQGTLSLTVPRIGAVSQDEGARDWTPLAPGWGECPSRPAPSPGRQVSRSKAP